jgi:hypothetical protein
MTAQAGSPPLYALFYQAAPAVVVCPPLAAPALLLLTALVDRAY